MCSNNDLSRIKIQYFSFISDMIYKCFVVLTVFRTIIADEESDSYSFQYQVDSARDNVHYGHAEDREGYHTIGSYKVLLPDGRTQVVEYRVMDKDSGYNAKVTYTGVARVDHVQYNQPISKYKAIKREISAASGYKPVKIKPYKRHHEHQSDDIFTTTVPETTESITVIPSPEIVTTASEYDLNNTASGEKHISTFVGESEIDDLQTRYVIPKEIGTGYQLLSSESSDLLNANVKGNDSVSTTINATHFQEQHFSVYLVSFLLKRTLL